MNKEPTALDEAKWNVEFVCVTIGGWPHFFVVSTQDIAQGEALLGYYGEKYSEAHKGHAEYLEKNEIL